MNLIKTINYKEQQLPLAFNMASFLKFCKITGINSVSAAQDAVQNAALNLDDPHNLELTCTMYHCGFAEGHRLTGKPYTMQVEDMMDPELIMAVGAAFTDSTVPEYNQTLEPQNTQSIEAAPNV